MQLLNTTELDDVQQWKSTYNHRCWQSSPKRWVLVRGKPFCHWPAVSECQTVGRWSIVVGGWTLWWFSRDWPFWQNICWNCVRQEKQIKNKRSRWKIKKNTWIPSHGGCVTYYRGHSRSMLHLSNQTYDSSIAISFNSINLTLSIYISFLLFFYIFLLLIIYSCIPFIEFNLTP